MYLPTLGRFLQVDPVEGGTPNNYVYPADPVNDFDLNGMMSMLGHSSGFDQASYNAAQSFCGGWQLILCAIPGGIEIKAEAKFTPEVLKLGSKGGPTAGKAFTVGVKRAVAPWENKCAFGCGRDATEVDHIIPKSRGGNNTLENAQPACRTCNASKGNKNFPKNYGTRQKVIWYAKRFFK